MAAKPESVITAELNCVKKVSKPLMEKKRRARINKCLNQLKNFLESVYSNNIRKRKLEKADILELTVKHLRHLHNTERGTLVICDSAEYQAGYRSCLASVSLYLPKSDIDRDSHSTMLTHLTSDLTGSRVLSLSTADSDAASTLRPSLQTALPYPNTNQTSDRCYCCMPKRIEIYDIDRVSTDAQVVTSESKELKTRHVSLKNGNVDKRYRFLGTLKQNYWRPW